MSVKCPKCSSELTKVQAVKPPTGFPQVILVACRGCGNRWEQWKPVDLDVETDERGVVT